MSCRSLSRSLAAEQQSYRKLLDDFRRDYAFRLLDDGRIDIKRAAHLLGFQDPGSFRRAFRGWTGTTITAWGRKDGVAATPKKHPFPELV